MFGRSESLTAVMSVGQVSVGRVSVGQVSVGRVSVGRVSVGVSGSGGWTCRVVGGD